MSLEIIKKTSKQTHQERYEICKKCPKFNKLWKTCKEWVFYAPQD